MFHFLDMSLAFCRSWRGALAMPLRHALRKAAHLGRKARKAGSSQTLHNKLYKMHAPSPASTWKDTLPYRNRTWKLLRKSNETKKNTSKIKFDKSRIWQKMQMSQKRVDLKQNHSREREPKQNMKMTKAEKKTEAKVWQIKQPRKTLPNTMFHQCFCLLPRIEH